MKPVAVMVAASLGCLLAASLVVDARVRVEVAFGMLGPLAVAAGSWVVVERAHRRNRETLMPLLIAGFAFKVVFFGAYVMVMIELLSLRPMPFALSFAAFFGGLHVVEALYLRRLFR